MTTPAWVDPPCGRTVMSHAARADKLLIKPTGWVGRLTDRKTSHRQGTPTKRMRAASLSTSHSAPQGQPASDQGESHSLSSGWIGRRSIVVGGSGK